MLPGDPIAATFIRAPAPCGLCGAAHAATDACRGLVAAGSGTLGVALGAAPSSASGGPDPLLGQTVGNFRIVRELGRGGMGVVYLAEHALIGSKVAIKFLHPHLAEDSALVERFFAEAKAANLVGHENIVSIVDLNLLPPNRYYLVMEYLEGRPLSALPLPVEPGVALSILVQICDALEAAHARGVVHRDLKPDNVFLLKRAGNDHFVKLVDFGIAKLGESGSQTLAGVTVGTPEFMAPEQWTGGAVDGRADLYAAGIIAYGLLTGRLPFAETTPLAYYHAHREKQVLPLRRYNPWLPEALEALVLKCLAKPAADRFQTAGAMRAALQAMRTPAPGPAPLPPRPETSEAPPAPVRRGPSIPVRVRWSGYGRERELVAGEVSGAGMLVFAEPPFPPLFSRVEVGLGQPGGAACVVEVVRHIEAAQARAWGMQPGYAVQLLDASAAFRAVLAALLAGEEAPGAPAPAPVACDDAAAEAALAGYRGRPAGDHYALLGLEPAADQGEVRRRCRAAQQELQRLSARPLSPAQRAELGVALARVQAAAQTLSEPARRAEYDARRGNYLGVARCLAAGLRVSEIETLRQGYLRERPKSETVALLHATSANAYLSGGDTRAALNALEQALTADPLGVSLHQRYWSLRRQLLARRTPPSAPKAH